MKRLLYIIITLLLSSDVNAQTTSEWPISCEFTGSRDGNGWLASDTYEGVCVHYAKGETAESAYKSTLRQCQKAAYNNVCMSGKIKTEWGIHSITKEVTNIPVLAGCEYLPGPCIGHVRVKRGDGIECTSQYTVKGNCDKGSCSIDPSAIAPLRNYDADKDGVPKCAYSDDGVGAGTGGCDCDLKPYDYNDANPDIGTYPACCSTILTKLTQKYSFSGLAGWLGSPNDTVNICGGDPVPRRYSFSLPYTFINADSKTCTALQGLKGLELIYAGIEQGYTLRQIEDDEFYSSQYLNMINAVLAKLNSTASTYSDAELMGYSSSDEFLRAAIEEGALLRLVTLQRPALKELLFQITHPSDFSYWLQAEILERSGVVTTARGKWVPSELPPTPQWALEMFIANCPENDISRCSFEDVRRAIISDIEVQEQESARIINDYPFLGENFLRIIKALPEDRVLTPVSTVEYFKSDLRRYLAKKKEAVTAHIADLAALREGLRCDTPGSARILQKSLSLILSLPEIEGSPAESKRLVSSVAPVCSPRAPTIFERQLSFDFIKSVIRIRREALRNVVDSETNVKSMFNEAGTNIALTIGTGPAGIVRMVRVFHAARKYFFVSKEVVSEAGRLAEIKEILKPIGYSGGMTMNAHFMLQEVASLKRAISDCAEYYQTWDKNYVPTKYDDPAPYQYGACLRGVHQILASKSSGILSQIPSFKGIKSALLNSKKLEKLRVHSYLKDEGVDEVMQGFYSALYQRTFGRPINIKRNRPFGGIDARNLLRMFPPPIKIPPGTSAKTFFRDGGSWVEYSFPAKYQGKDVMMKVSFHDYARNRSSPTYKMEFQFKEQQTSYVLVKDASMPDSISEALKQTGGVGYELDSLHAIRRDDYMEQIRFNSSQSSREIFYLSGQVAVPSGGDTRRINSRCHFQ